jgi:hypothetical protein
VNWSGLCSQGGPHRFRDALKNSVGIYTSIKGGGEGMSQRLLLAPVLKVPNAKDQKRAETQEGLARSAPVFCILILGTLCLDIGAYGDPCEPNSVERL